SPVTSRGQEQDTAAGVPQHRELSDRKIPNADTASGSSALRVPGQRWGRRFVMRRLLKWVGLGVLAVAFTGFLAFLYFIPPFAFMKPEEFSGPAGKAGPDLSKISDPGERMMAERGHYLVTLGSCADCHATPGPQGPQLETMYLAGGNKMTRRGYGTYRSMNL